MKTALQKRGKKRSGFSLVELVIVIAILAILAVAAIVSYRGLQQSARDSMDKANAAAIVHALNLYRSVANNPGNSPSPSLTQI